MFAGLKYSVFPFQCRKYRRKLSEAQKYRLREKMTASDLFKDKKAAYPKRYNNAGFVKKIKITDFSIFCSK